MSSGHSLPEIRRLARETFVDHNYLNDYVLPTVSLIRGRKFVRQLHAIFGDERIEALRRPYFCVTTNLTKGCSATHDRGPLHLWKLGRASCRERVWQYV